MRTQQTKRNRKMEHLVDTVATMVMLLLIFIALIISGNSKYTQNRCVQYGLGKDCTQQQLNNVGISR